jgi:hypothetical protein
MNWIGRMAFFCDGCGKVVRRKELEKTYHPTDYEWGQRCRKCNEGWVEFLMNQGKHPIDAVLRVYKGKF